MTWIVAKGQPDVLRCNMCESSVEVSPVRAVMLMAARAKGWHCFEGRNFTDRTTLEMHLCPKCVNSPRKGMEPAQRLEADEPLF